MRSVAVSAFSARPWMRTNDSSIAKGISCLVERSRYTALKWMNRRASLSSLGVRAGVVSIASTGPGARRVTVGRGGGVGAGVVSADVEAAREVGCADETGGTDETGCADETGEACGAVSGTSLEVWSVLSCLANVVMVVLTRELSAFVPAWSARAWTSLSPSSNSAEGTRPEVCFR